MNKEEKITYNATNSLCNKCGKKYKIGYSSPIGWLCKKCFDNLECPECGRPRNAEKKARQDERKKIIKQIEKYIPKLTKIFGSARVTTVTVWIIEKLKKSVRSQND